MAIDAYMFIFQLSQRTISGTLLKYLSKLQVFFGFTCSKLNLYFSYCFVFISPLCLSSHYFMARILIRSFCFHFFYNEFCVLILMSQVDEEPAIRTNTTILLGNIASYLNEGVRVSVFRYSFYIFQSLYFMRSAKLMDSACSTINVIKWCIFWKWLTYFVLFFVAVNLFKRTNQLTSKCLTDKEESVDKCIHCPCITR